jgi:hypothetical protein
MALASQTARVWRTQGSVRDGSRTASKHARGVFVPRVSPFRHEAFGITRRLTQRSQEGLLQAQQN